MNFDQLKYSTIDPIILSEENKSLHYAENNDSTSKLLIYQVPFSEIKKMSSLLSSLESQIGDVSHIDVENNSLEDAYINIAREEEKLLND